MFVSNTFVSESIQGCCGNLIIFEVGNFEIERIKDSLDLSKRSNWGNLSLSCLTWCGAILGYAETVPADSPGGF